ncbi:SDR family oxidoreductase [Microvirga antarctica]|uniref:SDR family oxidoreductase n=1 Tax=Microvirga antarctica TaxID=2819233 RepID=UPI001FE6E537|nr:SDR family oxidoreductase [Microvirga antarctica]
MSKVLDGSSILVTGASSGIGEELVRRLSSFSATIHATARSADKLAALSAETGCVTHALDMVDREAMETLVIQADPDVVVCNAGSNFGGSIGNASEAEIDDLVELNLSSVLHLIRLALPGMKRRNHGHIVFVGSIAGHHALTGGNAVYHATKAGIRAISDQLRVDLCGYRIRVTEIAPGRTRTAIFAKTIGDAAKAERGYFDGYEVLEPADVADIICYALAAPAHVNIGHIELTPTLQVIGGLKTVRLDQAMTATSEKETGQ